MTKLIQSALVAAVLVTGASAASARSQDVPYDNATPRSQMNLNSSQGVKAFWESVGRHGS